MGMGARDIPPATAEEWNGGSCDIMAVALHRIYGLPLMAEFEYGLDEEGLEVLGYLTHAWVRLPDGRALDAAGPRCMFSARDGGDPDDEWVIGFRIIEIRDDDPHLLDTREETDYVDDIREMRAVEWIDDNLGPVLGRLGIDLERSEAFQDLVASIIADLRRPPAPPGAVEQPVPVKSFATVDGSAEETYQTAFDAVMRRLCKEGRLAHDSGIPKSGNPYIDAREPHFVNAWRGGWAEAALEAMTAPVAPGRR